KAQQLEPKLYVGDIIEKTNPIVIPDSKETLMLAEESRLKMLLKQKDPIMLEKKVNTTPVDYVNYVISTEPTLSRRPTIVKFPKELPKVSMVNTSLKTLKHHLAGFDVVVKERTTPTAIIEGSWGSKHIKASFRDEIIPFVKALKDLFNTFNQYLVDELSEEIFQRDDSVSNQSAPSFDQLFELNELKAQSQEKDTVIKKLKEIIKSLIGKQNKDKIKKDLEEIETINIESDHRVTKLIAMNEHLKQTYKQLYDSIKLARIGSKEQCDDLINKVNLKYVEISDLNARVKPSTSASGSQPSGNTKKYKIRKTPSSTQKKKVEANPRKVKSSLKNEDCVVQPKGTDHVQHSKLNANSELKCVKCNRCMLSDNHDLRVFDFINNVNAHKKSKSINKSSKRQVWKPPGKVFSNIRYIWRPTGRTFTIVGNACPLTRITITTKVLKSVSANKKKPSPSWGSIVSNVPSTSLAKCRCSRGNNLYTLSLKDMMASSPICLLSKASKTKSWLWHRRLSHLNFGAINHLARHGLVRGLLNLKFENDHLYSACAMGKSKKKPHKPKSEDTNQEKLYLLHMDLCGPMRVASINGKKYILVIVYDISRFTWVKFLRSKDEALDFIIKFLKMIQVRLKVPVRPIRTNNGTEFVNQTLREYYEKVGISHETFVARSPQQNGVVKRRNRTLIEAARTMLIYSKAPLFL
ncbi:retrovirus-related pol polyprotein from transposon TNT 1-94, partial [Tanacetum coccineum]